MKTETQEQHQGDKAVETQINWTTPKGFEVTVTVQLVTSRTVSADGDTIEAPCCDLLVTASIKGKGIVGNGAPTRPTGLPAGYVAAIGKLPITAEQTEQIEAIIAEVKATPKWQAKMVQRATAAAAAAKYDAGAAGMRRTMGQ